MIDDDPGFPQSTDGQILASTLILKIIAFATFDDEMRRMLRAGALAYVEKLNATAGSGQHVDARLDKLKRDATETINFIFAGHESRMRPSN